MKIKLTVKHETEINIELPVFYKRPTGPLSVKELLAVLDDDHIINLYIGDSYESLNHATVENYKEKITEAFTNWERITEFEFMEAYEHYVSHLSLKPILADKPLHPGYKAIENSIK